jgi:membrane protease YdiL (CAAX protease family)
MREVTDLTLFKTSDFTLDRSGRETWFDVLTGPVRYRASTPWSPAAAIGVTALIASAQLALYGLSPGLGLSLILEIVTGCVVWFAAGLGNGTTRAVLSLPPLKGRVYTYVTLAVLVYSIMVPVRFLSQDLLSFLDSPTGPIQSATDLSSNWLWLTVLAAVITAPLTEEFMYRGFLLSALAKSKVGFWGAAIITDAAWTAMHASYQPWAALPAIFVLGLLVSFLLWRTGSLWTCIFAHMTVNAVTVFMAVLFGLVLR